MKQKSCEIKDTASNARISILAQVYYRAAQYRRQLKIEEANVNKNHKLYPS